MNINAQSLAKDLAMDALKKEILYGEEPRITYWDQAFTVTNEKGEVLKPKFQKMFNAHLEDYLQKIAQHRISS